MANGSSIRNITGLSPQFQAEGNFGIREGYPKNSPYLFGGVTGGFNSLYGQTGGGPNGETLADIISAPTGITTGNVATKLMGTAALYSGGGTNDLRAYIDFLKIKVLGNTAWTGGPWVQIQDTNGNTLIYIP